MPDIDRVRPRAATCEDYDEVNQTTLPNSRTTAKLPSKEVVLREKDSKSRRNGSDSGYASRADTVASDSLNRPKRESLRVNTGIVEREPQPYSIPYVPTPSTPSHGQSSAHPKEPKPEARPGARRQTYTHERGACWICDQYGKHIDIKGEMSRPSSAAPPQPSSPAATRQPPSKSAKDDDSLRPKPRRQSSARQPRPLNMVPPAAGTYPYAQQPMYTAPVMASPSWKVPPVTVAYTSVPYSYPVQPLSTPPYAMYQQPVPFADPGQAPSEPRPVKSNRRLSSYGEPIVQQTRGNAAPNIAEKPALNEQAPIHAAPKSARLVDPDRERMPPPPKPQPSETVGPRRPSANQRSQSFHPQTAFPTTKPSRDSVFYPDDEEDIDEDDYPETRPPPTPRGRRESSNLPPPSSYKGPPTADPRGRPVLQRKSVSMYTTPTATTSVASSNKSGAMVRRTTVPTMTLEEKLASAEDHQRRRGSATKDLTVENLRDLTHHGTGSRSESGSNYSHKSRQSSSKDSSGRGRSHTSSHTNGGTTNIHMPGGVKVSLPADYGVRDGRPVSINFGDVVISMGRPEKEVERSRELKRIERAPSVTSRTSKRSEASSAVSSREKDRDRDRDRDRDHQPSTRPSRRLSQLEDRVPSIRSSRAPSATRRSVDYSGRPSFDLQEEVYGA